MNLTKRLANANMSRVQGGIFFDEYRSPIKNVDLKTHKDLISQGKGRVKYFHLDEENCKLTTYTKDTSEYSAKVETLSLDEMNVLIMKYEVAHGFDISAHRFRKPYIED